MNSSNEFSSFTNYSRILRISSCGSDSSQTSAKLLRRGNSVEPSFLSRKQSSNFARNFLPLETLLIISRNRRKLYCNLRMLYEFLRHRAISHVVRCSETRQISGFVGHHEPNLENEHINIYSQW